MCINNVGFRNPVGLYIIIVKMEIFQLLPCVCSASPLSLGLVEKWLSLTDSSFLKYVFLKIVRHTQLQALAEKSMLLDK